MQCKVKEVGGVEVYFCGSSRPGVAETMKCNVSGWVGGLGV